jgi:hypothetical protein
LKRAIVATWRALNGGCPLTRMAPNRATGPWFDGQRQRRKMGLVVELDVLFADLCSGKTLFAERAGQGRTAGNDISRDDRIARLHVEGVAQPRRLRAGRLKSGETDRCETILRAGIGGQDYTEGITRFVRPGLDDGIVIALAAEQFCKKVGIGACPAADLCCVGGILVIGLERRLLAELLEQFLGIAKGSKSLDRDRVADLAGFAHGNAPALLFRRCRSHGRRRGVAGIEVRPGDAEIRHGAERSVRVELGRVRRRLSRSGLRHALRGPPRDPRSRAQQPCGPQP